MDLDHDRFARRLLFAAQEGVAKPEHWQAWAARRILEHDYAPGWVIDVCSAKDLDALSKALEPKLYEEMATSQENAHEFDAEAGVLWLRYRAGEMTFREMLYIASDDDFCPQGPFDEYAKLLFRLYERLEKGESEHRIEREAFMAFRAPVEHVQETIAILQL